MGVLKVGKNRESLVGEVMIGVFPGHSDQDILEFKISDIMRKRSAEFKRSNCKLFKKLVINVPWVHEGCLFFKNPPLKSQEEAIPLCWEETVLSEQKKKFYTFWNQDLALQGCYRAVVHICSEKTKKAKAQLELTG